MLKRSKQQSSQDLVCCTVSNVYFNQSGHGNLVLEGLWIKSWQLKTNVNEPFEIEKKVHQCAACCHVHWLSLCVDFHDLLWLDVCLPSLLVDSIHHGSPWYKCWSTGWGHGTICDVDVRCRVICQGQGIVRMKKVWCAQVFHFPNQQLAQTQKAALPLGLAQTEFQTERIEATPSHLSEIKKNHLKATERH